MPNAGWCRECGEWVWTAEDGGCQFGHGPECVESIHEQQDPDAPRERPFGVGELPRDLYRLNWGAFFIPFFWGLVYRSWPVIMAWLIAVTSPLLLYSLFGITDTHPPIADLVGATVLAEIVSGLVRIWAGVTANRALWSREAMRLEFLPGSEPRFTAEHFIGRQRQWGRWGAAIVAIGSFAAIPVGASLWEPYGLMYLGSAMPLLWLGVEVMLAWWLDARMREQGPDAGEHAQDMA